MTVDGKGPTKHQLKSNATRTALLDAAGEVFARDGYERAQIDEIAKLSGRTRGAVYSQYRTKEQLFFALQERRIQAAGEMMRANIDKHPGDVKQSLEELKQFYAELVDPDSDILSLELKLYAVRNPDCREAWRARYANLYSPNDDGQEFEEAFGVTNESGRSQIRSRMLALSAVKSGLVLAMRFMPKELSPEETSLLLKEIFEGLFPSIANPKHKQGSSRSKKSQAGSRRKK